MRIWLPVGDQDEVDVTSGDEAREAVQSALMQQIRAFSVSSPLDT